MSDSKVQELYERLRAVQAAAEERHLAVDYAVAVLDRPEFDPGHEPVNPVAATRSLGIASVRYDKECFALANSYSVAVAWQAGHAGAANHGVAIAGMETHEYPSSASSYAGDSGIAITNCKHGSAAANNKGIAIAGSESTAIAGVGTDIKHVWFDGIAIADSKGTAMAGNGGVALAGSSGAAVAGVGTEGVNIWCNGIAIAGTDGTAMAGPGGVIVIRDKQGVPHAGEIGKNDLMPGVPYRWDEEEGFREIETE